MRPSSRSLFGLLIGSFLNVCIYRWTRDLSVVSRSACPSCNRMIAWYDNVPVLSFLLLKGRCRHCEAVIAWTYPAVELLTALFFAYFVAIEGLGYSREKIACSRPSRLADFQRSRLRLLPDEFTVGGLVAGLAFAVFVPVPPTVFGLFAALMGLHPGLRITSKQLWARWSPPRCYVAAGLVVRKDPP